MINSTQQNYAKEVVKIFENQGPSFFKSTQVNIGAVWIVTVLSGMIGGIIGLKIGVRMFANPDVEYALIELKRMIKELKTIKKEKGRATVI